MDEIICISDSSDTETVIFEEPKPKKFKKKQTFICDYENCGKELSTLLTLKQHKLIHSGIKQHVCLVCNKKFTLKVYLTTHKQSFLHHKKSMEQVIHSNLY